MKSKTLLTLFFFCFNFASASALGQGRPMGSSEVSNTETSRKLSGQWKLSLLGLQTTNVSEQRKLISTNLDLKANARLMENLLVILEGSLRLQSGSVQALNASDDEKNPIKLKEAGLHYRPLPMLILSAGALDMSSTHSELSMDANAFPAIRASFQSGSLHNPDFRFFIESAIPTNTSLATDTQDFEATPELQSAGFQYQAKWSEKSSLKLSLMGFRWGSLPGSVAAKSYVKGNSVNLFSETLGAFDYGFSGFEAEILTRNFISSTVSVEPSLRAMQNSEAPEGLGQAWQAGLGSTLHTDTTDYSLSASRFEIQPDATVAFYGPTLLFNTNRTGYTAKFEINFKKHDFKVSARYADAELLFDNPVQSRERSILVKLETTYADF